MPGQAISGTWLSDDSGAVGSVKYFNVTTDDDGTAFIANGRINANWNSQIIWEPPCGEVTTASGYFMDVTAIGFGWTCTLTIGEESANASTHFVLPGAAPSTITSYGDFSTTYHEPQLRVYVGGSAPGFISSVSASSAVPGSSAAFPFPKQSNGSALAEGFYALVNTNVGSGGNAVFVDSSYLAVGGTTTLAAAFGADAADVEVEIEVCAEGECSHAYTYSPTSIFTQYYGDQINYRYTGSSIPVGVRPVAVKFYGSNTAYKVNGDVQTWTTTPANAIVVNSGSNTVSLLNLINDTTIASLGAGTQPMAVALNSAETMAYVANYGSSTLSEVNLSTNSVTRTASGVAGAQSVAMDPSGSYVWVGGTNYLYKVSLSSFTIVGDQSVAGSVTSLAASDALNELVYTLVQNCCSDSSAYVAHELLISNMSTPGTYAAASAAPYSPYTMNGTLPSAAVVPHASAVSAQFGNGMGASATPTGFVVYNLVSHQQLMIGTTPTPVRGIASDPKGMFAYFTLPDSNEYISVPLESTP